MKNVLSLPPPLCTSIHSNHCKISRRLEREKKDVTEFKLLKKKIELRSRNSLEQAQNSILPIPPEMKKIVDQKKLSFQTEKRT